MVELSQLAGVPASQKLSVVQRSDVCLDTDCLIDKPNLEKTGEQSLIYDSVQVLFWSITMCNGENDDERERESKHEARVRWCEDIRRAMGEVRTFWDVEDPPRSSRTPPSAVAPNPQHHRHRSIV